MELSYRMRGALARVAADLIRQHNGLENDAGVLRDFGALVPRGSMPPAAIADQFP